jgi:glyoxylase-like metal-dependent hydrolase (beta-lactamase superfamily II)
LTHADLVDAGGGVHAAIAKPDRGAVGNAAFVDLAGETLVVDTHYSPVAARELRAAAGNVAYVLNTHWHADHVLGNGEFADRTIVSTTRTRELIATVGAERLAAQKEAWEEELPAEVERLRAAGDEEGAAVLEDEGPELKALTHRLPDETFEESRDFGRAAALTFGGGHTESDAFVLVDGVLIAGDLVVVEMQPWAGHGDPVAWAGILDRLLELDWDTCVPGHGPVCGRDALPPLRDYLLALAEGGEVLERFHGWGQPEMWLRNLEALRG